MASDPLHFLRIADHYKTSGLEYERRTSIGRSYYAVYNFLWMKLTAAGVTRLKGNAGDHFRMTHFLAGCRDTQAGIVGRHLTNLKSARNHADYRMDLTIDIANSELALIRANKAVEEFNKADLLKITKLINALPDPPRQTRP